VLRCRCYLCTSLSFTSAPLWAAPARSAIRRQASRVNSTGRSTPHRCPSDAARSHHVRDRISRGDDAHRQAPARHARRRLSWSSVFRPRPSQGTLRGGGVSPTSAHAPPGGSSCRHWRSDVFSVPNGTSFWIINELIRHSPSTLVSAIR